MSYPKVKGSDTCGADPLVLYNYVYIVVFLWDEHRVDHVNHSVAGFHVAS
jgi:hypothetical protein